MKNKKALINNIKPMLQQATIKRNTKLSDRRKSEFEIFRYNLRLLRASVNKSASELSNELKLRTLKRINDLEEGRTSQPKFEEVLLLAKYFNVTLDQILYQKAQVSFKPYNV